MTSVPVSLPLTNGPPTVNSVLPPSLPMSLLTNPTLPNPTGVASNVSTTRILKLSGFNPDLKTRDIQVIFQEWEEDRGGFKLKWVDDVTCLIVFNDPTVAKRAFLTLLASPPPILSVDQGAKIQAYNGPDVTHILTSVQNRPRSRSNASSHSRKGSMNVSSPTSTGRRGSMNQGDGGNTVGHRTSFRNLAGAATNGNGNGGGNRNLPSSAQIQAAIDSATAGAGGGSALSSSPTSTQPPVGVRSPSTPPHQGKDPNASNRSPTESLNEVSFVTAMSSPSPNQKPVLDMNAGKRFINQSLGIGYKRTPASGMEGDKLQSQTF